MNMLLRDNCHYDKTSVFRYGFLAENKFCTTWFRYWEKAES